MTKTGELKSFRGNVVLVYRGKTYYDIEKMTKSHVKFSRPNKSGVSVVKITRGRYDKFMKEKAKYRR